MDMLARFIGVKGSKLNVGRPVIEPNRTSNNIGNLANYIANVSNGLRLKPALAWVEKFGKMKGTSNAQKSLAHTYGLLYSIFDAEVLGVECYFRAPYRGCLRARDSIPFDARLAHAMRKWKAKLFHHGVQLGHGSRLTNIHQHSIR